MIAQLAPLVAVTTDVFFHQNYDWHATPSTYLNAAFNGSGVIPLLVPSLGKSLDPEAILTRVDGLLLTGAKSNVHPEIYGETPTADHEPYDLERDTTSLPMIRMAIEMGLPVLAICRGLQELNVALGGTLNTEIQENDGIFDHRGEETMDNDKRFEICHSVVFEAGSKLANIYETAEIDVNSAHRQSIKRLGNSLRVEATASDGTVEAVTAPDAAGFAMGVQWHPEYWFRSDDSSAKVFTVFGDAVREYQARKSDLQMAAE